MGNGKQTFSQLLKQLEMQNARCLMQNARTANRIAKQLESKARSKAYGVKHKSLIALIERFPKFTIVSNDYRLPQMVVVIVAREKFGLHVPASYLACEGQEKCVA
jgi:hypothetical protein